MEYCGGGDLSKEIQKLKDNNQYASEEYAWSIFSQLIAAMYRCHYGVNAPEVGSNVMGQNTGLKPLGLKGKNQVMILHRDLKPENGRSWLRTLEALRADIVQSFWGRTTQSSSAILDCRS